MGDLVSSSSAFLPNIHPGNTPVRHPTQHRNVFAPICSEQKFAKFTFLDGSILLVLPLRSIHGAVHSSHPGLPPDKIAQLLLNT